MRNRLLPIILLIGGLLVLAVAGVAFILQQDSTTTTVETVEGTQVTEGNQSLAELQAEPVSTVDMINVVVSLQTVQRGWQMTENELTTDQRLSSSLPANVITDTNVIVGLYARHDIFQGETLTLADFVSDPRLVGQEDYGPSSLVPTGWVAMAVPMDRLGSVAYGLAEGDTIDVLMSFTFNEVDEQFQTLLLNSATFILEATDAETGEVSETVFMIDPLGRFEDLPTGDLAHVFPSEDQRPFNVSMLLQNARVIQVGMWMPSEPVAPPTPTLAPDAPTPTPGGPPPTPTPLPPDVILLALPPQQQLFLKYAVESQADIDFALRNPNDAQLNNVQNVDLNYLLEQFNFEIPPDFDYTLDAGVRVTATPVAGGGTTPDDETQN